MYKVKTLIFTDLDGTLLDHFSYDHTPALATLNKLKLFDIPVIFTTSKTLAETKTLQQELNTEAPMIVENGAAIYLPKSLCKTQPEDTIDSKQYWLKSFCQPRKHWLEVIARAPKQFHGQYQGFAQLSVSALAELTGLSPDEALQAKDRHFGEPVHWLGEPQLKAAFINYLTDAGAQVLQGGRFFHVSGQADKGQALTWLARWYQAQTGPDICTIALGDSDNDIAMLEAAGIAVQVRTPVHDFPVLERKTWVYQTKHFGPAGWAEALNKLLPELLLADNCSSNQNYEVNHG